jgi:ribosome-associated toxin RatA of RatAB toxin-antitoxin module
MAFTVEVDVDSRFEAACTTDRAYEIVSDVPWSVSHFPKMDRLVDMGGGKYRWEMEKIGVDKYYIQTVYACKYVCDDAKQTVKWTPVKNEGNGTVSGKWTLKALDDKRTELRLQTKASLELPFPRLAKMIVAPVVRHEFESMIDKYLENLTATLESKKKRPKKKLADEE